MKLDPSLVIALPPTYTRTQAQKKPEHDGISVSGLFYALAMPCSDGKSPDKDKGFCSPPINRTLILTEACRLCNARFIVALR